LATGRTHQIRVHMSSIGHPLIGDPLYGRGRPKSRAPEPVKGLLAAFPRQALHAKTLGFEHPISREKLLFQSKIPNDLNGLINSLKGI
jgi:23S rRNA pseudouridine1911/1915/1917 synthase